MEDDTTLEDFALTTTFVPTIEDCATKTLLLFCLDLCVRDALVFERVDAAL